MSEINSGVNITCDTHQEGQYPVSSEKYAEVERYDEIILSSEYKKYINEILDWKERFIRNKIFRSYVAGMVNDNMNE